MLGKSNPFSKKKRILEKTLEKEIIDHLRQTYGIFCWKNYSQGVFDPISKRYRKMQSITGVSDILGILPSGRFLAIEVKSPDNPKRPKHQAEFIDNINLHGGLAFFCNSIKEVDSVLSNIHTGE